MTAFRELITENPVVQCRPSGFHRSEKKGFCGNGAGRSYQTIADASHAAVSMDGTAIGTIIMEGGYKVLNRDEVMEILKASFLDKSMDLTDNTLYEYP